MVHNVDSGIPADKAAARAKELATGSWEIGTVAQALLELYNPELTVFGLEPFPNGEVPLASVDNVQSLQYALQFIRTDSDTLQHDDGMSHLYYQLQTQS